MIGRAFLNVAAWFLAVSAGAFAGESPAARFSVACDAGARPWERTAARELEDYLGRLAQDGDVRLDGKSGVVFHVGDTAFARERGLASSAFEDEAWAVRSFGTDVVVNGGGTRGCLYAAYNFLEKECGVRWWADGEEDVPEPRRLAFDGLDLKGRPFFEFRAIFRTARASDPRTAIRNRVNYEFGARERADLGGTANFAPPYFCHNWNQVLPFDRFGKAHPEWYSLRNGKRVGGAYEGQLCTTCPTLPAAFAAEVEKHLAEGTAAAGKLGLPPPKYFDISMNDNRLFCTCPACAAETERHGHSGRQLRFENQVAALVGAKHPDVKFTVFSYYHSEPAPSDDTRAADNVIVRVCDTRGNLAAPVSDPSNGFMRKQIQDWARHAGELFVWDYMITFFRPETFDFPLPSELHYGEKFRFYAENSVRGLFLEQERPDTADLHAVKYWMEAKLMENPYLDADRLFLEAMRGYYGPAAEELIGIRRELARLCVDYGGYVTYEPLVAAWNWLPDEAVSGFLATLDAVERKVAADAKILRRVRRFRHAFDAVRDLRSEFGGLKPPENGVSDRPFFDFHPNPRVFTVSSRATNLIESVSDPAAFAGRAMRMDNADGKRPEFALPFEWGYYDQTGEKTYKSVIERSAGPGYNWYDLQEIDFPEHSGFLYFNSQWSLQMNVAAPLLKGKVRVRLHASFEKDETRIDRVVIIPLDGAPAAEGPGFDRQSFANPPSEFAPGLFWMWNDRLDADVLQRQLEDMAAHGVKSVCIHPVPSGFRPKRVPSRMEPDYLTPEFMEVFARVMRRAKELGMAAWLYDEGGWPSGGACGRVLAGDKTGDFLMRRLRPRADGTCTVETVKPADPKVSSPYPSIVERGVTERFIELTHEAYFAKMPELFGSAIRFAFTDEPDYVRSEPGRSFGWTRDFDGEFKARKGYDFRDFARAALDPALDDERAVAARIDYFDVMTDLYCERFLLPIRDWCRGHGILSGGHLNCEHRPDLSAVAGHGSVLRALGAMDVPGVDTIWRQLFPGLRDADRPFPRYASSAMHQNGGKYALSESFGIYGDGLTPDQMRWVVNFQLVRGINLFVFGYCPVATDGRWVTLFEPHFGSVNPLWDFSEPFFRETARTASLLAQGRPGADTLVLYDVRAAWANETEAAFASGAQLAAARTLDRRHCDYDFAEDRQIAAARVEDGRLVVGAMRYGTVVLPTSRRMLPAARARLDEFRKAGGLVLSGDEMSRAPGACRITGQGAGDLRVLKRIAGDETLYCLFNEATWPVRVRVGFDEKGSLVRADPASGDFIAQARAADGSAVVALRGGETAIFIVGARANRAAETRKGSEEPDLGWTLQPKTRFWVGEDDFAKSACTNAPVAAALGDWRELLGEEFCGTAVYRTSLERTEDAVCELDLGTVGWTASLRVNGEDLGARFGSPYAWRVNLRKGRNDIEVTVANLLANALTDEVRARARRQWPASSYDGKQASFDCQTLGGGLFGPVRLSVFGRRSCVREIGQ